MPAGLGLAWSQLLHQLLHACSTSACCSWPAQMHCMQGLQEARWLRLQQPGWLSLA